MKSNKEELFYSFAKIYQPNKKEVKSDFKFSYEIGKKKFISEYPEQKYEDKISYKKITHTKDLTHQRLFSAKNPDIIVDPITIDYNYKGLSRFNKFTIRTIKENYHELRKTRKKIYDKLDKSRLNF